jgi:hypothetical protein
MRLVGLLGGFLLALALLASNASYASADACHATSGTGTAAVVELYTSEGCSSCPPADRELSTLSREAGPGSTVIPLGLHVTYWDSLGWQDIMAQKVFDARQSELAAAGHSTFVYTPEFFANGEEIRSWHGSLSDAIRRINTTPALVEIALTTRAASNDTVELEARVTPRDSGALPADGAQLYFAVTEDGLVSHVLRGENGGTTLSHDGVVRLWVGPVSLGPQGGVVRRDITVSPQWDRARLHFVALVQNGRDQVLQAVSAGTCGAS